MKINLNDATVLGKIARSALGDNRILGLLSGKIVEAVLGGAAIGGGNRQIQWVSPEGVLHGLGTGELSKAFVSSSSKGVGRGGKALKDGDKFCHLSVCLTTNAIYINFYTREEAERLSR